ncbi:MAG: aldehyde ferredoxin oxidoreductase family protein [Chloroflexi bacterium]|nr:aldehyde ferredoxin oxidoreductase family protein [Chloroflexota bacterium]
MGGWMGQVLVVDLASGCTSQEPLDPRLAEQYLGGRGLGARLLYDRLPPGVDPLGPRNALVFATGPLTGTRAPTGGRFSVSTRSPATGTLFDANAGGQWGVRFKATGYDALVIEGASERPVYLVVDGESAELRSAEHLWGLDVPTTTDRLVDELGKGFFVACIGPAGERQVLMAAIMNDRERALGRGGVGAVMGSKHLKAIAVRGDRRPEIARPEAMDFVVYECNKIQRANPVTASALPEFGTAVILNIMNEAGALPTRNFQDSTFEGAEAISGEALADKLLVRKRACWGCSIACTRVTRIGAREGEGPEYETLWSLGANCGIDDLEAIAEANALCNALGLDTISVGATIACAMELQQQGIHASGLRFGQAEALLPTIRDIAYRRGLGDELADGALRYAERHGAPELAMQVKGLELPAYDPRGMQGQGLGYATSNRGGCHMRANMLGPELLGIPKLVDRFQPRGRAGILIVHQHLGAVMDSLVLCKFAANALNQEHFARLLSAATGIDYSAQRLLQVGERLWNLERLFNLREGFTRVHDTLPRRLLQEAARAGPSAGAVVQLEPMLQEYYRFRGWNPEGTPDERKLRELDLEPLPVAPLERVGPNRRERG